MTALKQTEKQYQQNAMRELYGDPDSNKPSVNT